MHARPAASNPHANNNNNSGPEGAANAGGGAGGGGAASGASQQSPQGPVVLLYGLQRKLLVRAPAFEAAPVPVAAVPASQAAAGSGARAPPPSVIGSSTSAPPPSAAVAGNPLSGSQALDAFPSGGGMGSSASLTGMLPPPLMTAGGGGAASSSAGVPAASPAAPMPSQSAAFDAATPTTSSRPPAAPPQPAASPSALGPTAKPGQRAIGIHEGSGVPGVEHGALALLLGERQFLGTFALRLPTATVLGHPVVLNRDHHHRLLNESPSASPNRPRPPPASDVAPTGGSQRVSPAHGGGALPTAPSTTAQGRATLPPPMPPPSAATRDGGAGGGLSLAGLNTAGANPVTPEHAGSGAPASAQQSNGGGSERASSAFVVVVVPDACTASRDAIAVALAAFAMTLQHVEHCDGYVCAQITQLQRMLSKAGDRGDWAALLKNRGPRLASELNALATALRSCTLPPRAPPSPHRAIFPGSKPIRVAGVVSLDLEHVVARTRALHADPTGATKTVTTGCGPQPQLPLVPPITVRISRVIGVRHSGLTHAVAHNPSASSSSARILSISS